MTYARRVFTSGVCLALALLFAGAAAATPSTHLTRIYRGNDGSALYLRQIGGATGTVYGFGEHPGRNIAYVLKGKLSNELIDGDWWDVPKGRLREDSTQEVSKGAIVLKWSQGGDRIVRVSGADLGPDTFTAIAPTGLPWPAPKLAAEFQSVSSKNLTGAFDGDDSSRHYVRETDYNVVWVAEKGFQPGERPGWVSVFAGNRQKNGRVAGTWVDVPKGLEARSGSFDALQVPGTRQMLLGGDARTKGLEPDYAIDFKKFGKEIERDFGGKVTGFGYAIAKDGAIVAKGGGGYRLVYLTGSVRGEPFTPETQNGADSSTKTVTAAAVLRALAAKGLSVDTKVEKYLPSCWKKGPGVSGLTFRDLLGHTSLLYEPANPDCSKDPYRCLEVAIANGRQAERDKKKDGYDYENINYSLMRPILAFVVTDRKLEADFKLFKCKNTNDELNERLSTVFVNSFYGMLKGIGVKARFGPTQENKAFRYKRGEERKLGGYYPDPKKNPTRSAGAGGWWASAVDYVRFQSALDRGELVPERMLGVMKAGRLGFDRGCTLSDALGACYWKGGDYTLSDGRGSESVGILLPGGVQVFITINSKGNKYLCTWLPKDKQDCYRGWLVINAYYKAFR